MGGVQDRGNPSATTFDAATILLEDGKSTGAQADFRFVDVESTFGTSVEVKAVGLSEAEVDFCRRMAPTLPRLLPSPQGIVTVHAPLSGAPPQNLAQIRRIGRTDAPRRSRTVPNFPTGMRAAAIAARGAEPEYVRRAARKAASAVRQLPANGDSCWVALHWSNGAPMRAVLQAIDWATIPARVDGLLLAGTGVAFPDRNLHVFQAVQPREAAAESGHAEVQSLRDGMHELAEAVLGRFERSAGVRPTLVQVGRRVLINRDGALPIAPFNLLLDSDPAGLERSTP